MTNRTVMADRVTRIVDMPAFVTAKTSREKLVPDVVRIGAPVDLHLREEVCAIDFSSRLLQPLDVGPTSFPNVGHLRPLELFDG